jgi:PAS domain S-box-containing protein
MDFPLPASFVPCGAGCQDPPGDGIRGAAPHAGIHGMPWASVARIARDGGGRRVLPELGATLIAITVVILVQSLIGPTWTVLGFCLALGIAASQRVGHRLLFIASAATLAANTLVLPMMFRSVPDSSGWAWLPLWCLEGLLINWLVVEFLKEIDTFQAVGAGAPATTAEEAALISADLLGESSSQCQERFRLLVESIADYAIVMLGPDGRVKCWNLGAERILGYSAAEVLGRNYSVFHFAGDVRRGLPGRDLEAALAQGKLEIEGWRRRKDQSWFWAHVGFTPMRNPSGALLGFATVIRDSTEKRRAEESLRQARDELELRVRDRTAELAAANRALQAEILERKQAQEVLLKQSSVLRSILDSIGDAIIVAEDLDRPLTFNPAARNSSGSRPIRCRSRNGSPWTNSASSTRRIRARNRGSTGRSAAPCGAKSSTTWS